MGSVTQVNAYSFDTKLYDITTSLASMFTPVSGDRYIIKGLRLTNYSGGAVTVSVKLYSGADTTDYWVLKDHSVSAGASYEVLSDTPLVICECRGDLLKLQASANTSVHAVATFMELGRQTGF